MSSRSWDFSRLCRRADGSVYGTSGVCRKGVEISGNQDRERYLNRVTSGKDDLSRSERKEADRILYDGIKDYTDLEARVKRLTDKGLSKEEAHGVISWVGKDYPRINKSLYSDEKDEWAEAAAFRAAQGMRKLDKFDRQSLESKDPRWGAVKGNGTSTGEDRVLRGVNIPWNKMDEFLSEKPVGSEFVNTQFMGSAGMTTHSFLKRSSVLLDIRHKGPEETTGVTIDEFKVSRFEAEVMFPPGGKFRVAEVKRGSRNVELNVPQEARGRFPKSIVDDPESMLKLERIAEWRVTMAKTKSVSKQESLMRKLEREKDFLDSLGVEITPDLAQEYHALFSAGLVKENIVQTVVTIEEI